MKKMRKINYLVIHCTATRADRRYTVEALETDHLARGFSGIGYHFYIPRDGTLIGTRPVAIPGAHVRGRNAHSIGICYEGGLDAEGRPCDTRTDAQKQTMRRLVAQLLRRYPEARVCGHRDLSPDADGNGVVEPDEWVKLCPCFDVSTEL